MRFSPLSRFIFASGLTNLADGVATVAWAWVASVLTRDPLLIALVPVVLRLPWFLFAVPAGLVTDRVDRRWLIMAMDLIRGLGFAMAALALSLSLPLPEAPAMGVSSPLLFWLLLAAAGLVGGAEVFRDNAAQTMLPSLADHSDLERANGRLWSVELIGNALIGPALGAFLLAVTLPLPFLVNALAYLAAIGLLSQLKGRFRPEAVTERDWRKELKQGFDFLKNAPLLRVLALITGVWNLLFHMMLIALVLHAQENLGVEAQVYGLILAGGAMGGVCGGWMAASVIRRIGPARTAQLALAASTPAFVAIALAPGPLSLALTLAIFEFMGLMWNTVSVSYRQRRIPDALLGRVNSLYRLLAWGMMPVGLALSGVIVRLADGPLPRETALIAPFLVAAFGALMLALFGWRALGRGFSQRG